MNSMEKKLRILFMGTPEFAVESLEVLIGSSHEIIGVVTAPDRPAGRGGKMRSSAVKQYAELKKIKVLQPDKLKSPEFLEELTTLCPDLIVVVAFRMLPKAVWEIPSLGTINLHASLLPNYRGAAPINWAIINGETQTGATTFFINEEIDTGDIIDSVAIDITPDMDAGSLHDELKTRGALLLLETVNKIAADEVSVKAQHLLNVSEADMKPAPKLTNENTRINWSAPTNHVINLIRGLCPYPGAYTMNPINGDKVKIYAAAPINNQYPSGEIHFSDKHIMEVGTGDGALQIESIQIPGKRRMPIADFLNGMQNREEYQSFQ